MMIAWNKEKIAFAASVAVLVLVVISNLPSWTGGPLKRFVGREPQTGVSSDLDTGVKVDWYRRAKVGSPRNPFQAISDWRAPRRDPLPLPALGELERRVPLPAPIASAPGARPPREEKMPETEEQGAPSEEGGR